MPEDNKELLLGDDPNKILPRISESLDEQGERGFLNTTTSRQKPKIHQLFTLTILYLPPIAIYLFLSVILARKAKDQCIHGPALVNCRYHSAISSPLFPFIN